MADLLRKNGTGDIIDIDNTIMTPKVLISSSNDEAANANRLWIKSISATSAYLKQGANILAEFNPSTGLPVYNFDYAALAAALSSYMGLGTAATRNVGTAVGNLVEVITGGKLPMLDGSNLTNLSVPTVPVAAQIPIGGIIAWPTNAIAPSGLVLCDGVAISRTTYATLFSLLGTWYGVGDGSTTFNLPDYRGEFLRGSDAGRGVDTGRTIGSAQAQMIQSHTHAIEATNGGAGANTTINAGLTTVAIGTYFDVGAWRAKAAGGAETRPRNVSVHYLMRVV